MQLRDLVAFEISLRDRGMSRRPSTPSSSSSEVEDVICSVEMMRGPRSQCKLMRPTCFHRKTIFVVCYGAGKN